MQMKKIQILFMVSFALMILLSACNLGTTLPAVVTEAPVIAAPTEAPALAPVATAAVESTPTLAPINLAGPEMSVGSTWDYVDGSIIVAVPGGEFIMGRGGSDNPQHTVSLAEFWIYRNEVTNQQYAACVAAGKCAAPNLDDNQGYAERTRANDPVVGVMWDQANSYCQFVHGRLPTEAEWEKTARGPDGNIYPWGDQAPTCGLLNFNNCLGKTTLVDTYPQGQSFYKADDMAGNVFEWVADWYDPVYYSTSPVENPIGPEAGTRRSIRSTGYKANGDQAAAAVRFFDAPSIHRRDLGFRCVVEDPTYYAPYCQQAVDYVTTTSGPAVSGLTAVSCPIVGVDSQAQSCKAGTAYVTFKSTDPAAVISGVSACGAPIVGAPGSFPQTYNCAVSGTASIDTLCSFAAVGGTTSCAAHYTLDPATGACKWDGTGSISDNCPVGYQFDSAAQCCTALETNGTNYPLCKVGSTLVEDPPGKFQCVPNAIVPAPSHDEVAILLPVACGGGNSETPGASTCTNPSQYSNQGSCVKAGCVWVVAQIRAPYCTYP
jgi:formylglycine-generating enzyme required for sulfatase activity